MPGKNRFGWAIRAIREKRGSSLTEFAARVGLSKSTLSKIESNTIIPGADTIARILRVNGVVGDEYLQVWWLSGKIPPCLDSWMTNPQALEFDTWKNAVNALADFINLEDPPWRNPAPSAGQRT